MIKNRSLPPELTGASRGMACGRVRLDEWRNVFQATIGLALLLGVANACSDKPEASSKALAIINGKEITASEFDLRWSQIPDYARKTFAGPEGRKKFLESSSPMSSCSRSPRNGALIATAPSWNAWSASKRGASWNV